MGTARFDETGWSLSVDGRPAILEAKPLAVLHELLLRAGETLTKDELLDAVWPARDEPVGEASLATAVSKLRRAIGDAKGSVVVTVPTIGYRLGVPVTVETAARSAPRHAFAGGEAVPGRPQWTLAEPLGATGTGHVWRARNASTDELRVFKFADTPEGLVSLKREAALARRLAEVADAPARFPRLLEWSFEAPPFFLEYADGGTALPERENLSADERIAAVAVAASALAAAHGVGVLHAGMVPGDIVLNPAGTVRMVGLGGGQLLGDHHGAEDGERNGATPFRAPELSAGGPHTAATDIFALGVILYQAVVGDFRRPLAAGWEAEVTDPLIVADIAAAAASDPARRLRSAADLAERLGTLPARRLAAEHEAAEAERQRDAAERDRRQQLRRPWVRAAALAAGAGLLATSVASVYAMRARDTAVAERGAATAAYDFLADDLLARVSPGRADAADETLTQAVLRARDDIDRRFAARPLVAARLHGSLAGALHQRAQWAQARRSYALAEAAYARAGATAGPDAAENRMALAATEAASAEPGSLNRARRLVAAERARGPLAEQGAAGVKLFQAEGLIAYFGDPSQAPDRFARAVDLADRLPQRFTPAQRLQLRQAAGMALLRTGQVERAAPILARTADRLAALKGPDHPDALLARGSALTAASLAGHNAEVVPFVTALLPRMERRFGSDHRFTLAMVSLRVQALVGLGRLPEATRDADRVWRATAARGTDDQQARVAELELAELLCLDGQAERGLPHARVAQTGVLRDVGAAHPLAHTAGFITGECLAAAGEPRRALALFAIVDPLRVGQQVANANWAPHLHLARAEAYLATGDRSQAQREAAAIGAPAFATDPQSRARLQRLHAAMADR